MAGITNRRRTANAYLDALARAKNAEERQMVRDAWARGHKGQHELEMCSGCRIVVMGPTYWEFD